MCSVVRLFIVATHRVLKNIIWYSSSRRRWLYQNRNVPSITHWPISFSVYAWNSQEIFASFHALKFNGSFWNWCGRNGIHQCAHASLTGRWSLSLTTSKYHALNMFLSRSRLLSWYLLTIQIYDIMVKWRLPSFSIGVSNLVLFSTITRLFSLIADKTLRAPSLLSVFRHFTYWAFANKPYTKASRFCLFVSFITTFL